MDDWSPESTMARLTPPRPDGKQDRKHATGDAAKDGYTAHGRRARGDVPGEIVSKREADMRESPPPMPWMASSGAYDYDD